MVDSFRTRMVAVVVLVLAIWPAATPLQAQESVDQSGSVQDWFGPLITDPVVTIFTPSNGAVLVRTPARLIRSDDGGTTFRGVPLTPSANTDAHFPPLVHVDLTDPNILYTTGEEFVSAHTRYFRGDLLYKSTDGGATWRSIIPNSSYPEGTTVARLASSPADQDRLYAGLVPTSGRGSGALLSSVDGGVTWSTLQDTQCSLNPYLLQAHPTDPAQVFESRSCYPNPLHLQRSTDAGKTFQPFWTGATPGAEIVGLVGGHGAAPARWYLAINNDSRTGGSSVLRTDDNGATWSGMLVYTGGGWVNGQPPDDPNAWNIAIQGLVSDPEHPDTLYVARTAYGVQMDDSGPAVTLVTSGVTATSDGGTTWSDLGSQNMGKPTDLALSSDRKTLYLGSDQGLFALSVRP